MPVLIIFFLISCGSAHSQYLAKRGIIDLRGINWDKTQVADLHGEWEFYWNSLHTPSTIDTAGVPVTAYADVPGFWNNLIPGMGMFKPAFGYATYRLTVLCPPSSDKLALKFLTVASAYKIFVNGRQIVEVGRVGTNTASVIPAFQPLIIPVTPENGKLNILVQVANFTYNTGGLWDFIKLGPPQQVHDYRMGKVAWDFFLTGSFFLIGIFYLVIYFFFRRSKASLYFAVFCILGAIRPLVTGELAISYVFDWNWLVVKRVEFVAFYLTIPVLSLFSYELFRKEFSKKMLHCILIISIPFVLATLFMSPLVFRYTLRPFQVFMLLTACYGLYVYITAARNKRTGSGYFLAGFIFLFITLVNDLLYTSLVFESTNLVYAGLFIFVICQATALSKQFFHTFIKLETLNKKLEQVNDVLNQKNNTIHQANEQLIKLNAELDSLVYRTSHDLRSPITSISALNYIIKEEPDVVKRSKYLEIQKKTLLRLDALISDILDFAKNKNTELQLGEIDFAEYIKNALSDHILSDNSEKIKRIVEVNQQGIFKTDRMRFGMVINNLISNGLKYHKSDNGTSFLKILVNTTENDAIIEVSDNGHGIAEDHIAHIFTMFYRANNTLTGSGLGLYIVKEAIEKLGGTITLESKVNVGTKFIFVIPNMVSDDASHKNQAPGTIETSPVTAI